MLADFSLDVEPGQTVAIVGPSGAGKTTLVSLLLRFVDPQAGAVRIGGHDLRDLPAAQLRRMVALVAQDTYLFGGTVRENRQRQRLAIARAVLAGRHDELLRRQGAYARLVATQEVSA